MEALVAIKTDSISNGEEGILYRRTKSYHGAILLILLIKKNLFAARMEQITMEVVIILLDPLISRAMRRMIFEMAKI